VGLHVLNELYALFSDEDNVDSPITEDDTKDLCLYLVGDFSNSVAGVKTLQF
jgi:hypothetical protein